MGTSPPPWWNRPEAAPKVTVEPVAGIGDRPEAARWMGDRWCVTNEGAQFGPGGDAEGATDNGYLSCFAPGGSPEVVFNGGKHTNAAELDDAAGMAAIGNRLWIVDAAPGACRLVETTVAPEDPVPHAWYGGPTAPACGLLNDIAVGPDGAVYVTDSIKDLIWRWQPVGSEPGGADSEPLDMQVWLEASQLPDPKLLQGPNGISFDRNGNAYVATVGSAFTGDRSIPGHVVKIPMANPLAARAVTERLAILDGLQVLQAPGSDPVILFSNVLPPGQLWFARVPAHEQGLVSPTVLTTAKDHGGVGFASFGVRVVPGTTSEIQILAPDLNGPERDPNDPANQPGGMPGAYLITVR